MIAPFVMPFRVRSYECGPDGGIAVPHLLDYLQETASEHACALGFDHPVVDEATGARGAWVLAQIRLDVVRAPRWRDDVRVDTFPHGVRALSADRDFAVTLADGTPCATASTRWMVMDPVARRAVRVPAFVAEFDSGREPVFGPGDPFTRLRPPPAGEPQEEDARSFKVMRAHIDLNGHVNNAHYAAWMLESLPQERVAGARLEKLEIAFRSETLYGETVASSTRETAPGAFFHRVMAPGGRDHVLGVTLWIPA